MSEDAQPPVSGGSDNTARRLTTALLVVSIAHALSPLILRGIHSALGWDETVYISQIDPHVPAGQFTAPRARGLTLLTAPASLLSPSLALMRVWLASLSGVGMFLAFLPWLRVRRSYVVPLAALLWSGLWTTTYYGFEAMPNQYVAYGALAASGWLVLWLRGPQRRRWLWYATAAVAFTTLIRPSDSVFVLVPLIGAVLVSRGLSHRLRAVGAALLAAGFAAGIAEWIVEAYVRFGGPIQRFRAASAENVGGLHWSLGAEMNVLGGPILCRGTCQASTPVVYRLWWFALPLLVLLGMWVARRHRDAMAYTVAAVVGVFVAAQYLIAIGYGAPRFLEPSYALLALPAAEGVVWLWRQSVARARPLAIAAALVLLVAHEGIQLHLLEHNNDRLKLSGARAALMADYLADTGVHGPNCYVGGIEAGQIAFLAHCHVLAARTPPDAQIRGRATAVVIAPSASPPREVVVSWAEHTLTEESVVHGWTVWRLNPPPLVLNRQV